MLRSGCPRHRSRLSGRASLMGHAGGPYQVGVSTPDLGAAAPRSGRCGQQADMPAGRRSARRPIRVAGNHPTHASVRALPALQADDRAPGRGVPSRGPALRSWPTRPRSFGIEARRKAAARRGGTSGHRPDARLRVTRRTRARVLWPLRRDAPSPFPPGARALESRAAEPDSVASEHPRGARCARWRGGGGRRDSQGKEGQASRKVSSSSSGKTSEGDNPKDVARTKLRARPV